MRKSVEEKAKQRQDNEARRADGKDRSAHLTARGKSLLPLAALSKRALDDDEFMNALQEMQRESDRGAAIMGAALLEEGLRKLIEAALENKEDDQALFDDQGAPFYSLHAKTIAAFGMGLVDKQTKKDIDIVRGVRNQFSHALRAIKFSNEAVPVPVNHYPDMYLRAC